MAWCLGEQLKDVQAKHSSDHTDIVAVRTVRACQSPSDNSASTGGLSAGETFILLKARHFGVRWMELTLCWLSAWEPELTLRLWVKSHPWYGESVMSPLQVRAYIHTYIYTHTYKHTYIHTHIQTNLHTHIHTYIHTHIQTYTYIHTNVHIHTHTYKHTYTYIHTNVHIYIYTHTHIQTNIHTHIHRGTRWGRWLKQCATSLKVVGSIPDGVIGIIHWHNPCGRTMVVG